MVLESYDKYEFKLLDGNGYSPSQFIRELNKLGNEGWKVIQSYGDPFRYDGDAHVLLERKITCDKLS